MFNPPHIHVRNGDGEFTITLETREIEGKARVKSIQIVNKFIDEHLDELYNIWNKAQRVDLSPLLKYPAFEELRDEKKFIQFGLDQTIFWKNGADIAPEYLYDHGFAIA